MIRPILSLLFVACWIGALDHSRSAVAQDAPDNGGSSFQRQIFVPFESLDVLLEGNSNRVLMTRKEYDALLESARTREIQRAPVDGAIVSADYQGRIADEVAVIQAELVIEPLNDGLVEVPLSLSGVSIRSAELGDEPAKLWRNPQGQIVLLASGKQRQTLTLELQVPLQISAAQQSMSLQLPSPSATQFELTVPGNVEVKSGLPVANRHHDAKNDATQFDLLASTKPMNIVLSLNNRQLKDDQIIVSRSVAIHNLTPHLQEIHLTCSLDIIRGALEEIEFAVPQGFEVSDVQTELLSQWEMAEPTGANRTDEQTLRVKLRQATRDDVVLNVVATRNEGVSGPWTAERLLPLNVDGQVSVVGVLADAQLKATKLQSQGVIPIDHQFLLNAIPTSSIDSEADDMTVVAAYYVPQSEYSISASLTKPDPRLTVGSSSRLVIEKGSLQWQGGISLQSRYDARFGFRLELPATWRLDELTDSSNNRLQFHRLDDELVSAFWVHLGAQIDSDEPTKVFFKASRTPENWLEDWKSNQIEFPTLVIDGQSEHAGAIAVATDEDLTAKPTQIDGLDVLEEQDKKRFELDRRPALLAYRFEDSDYRLTLDLQRIAPTITARSYRFFKIEPTQITVRTEIVYDVQRSKQSQFKFRLPLSSPKSLSIAAKTARLKDYQSVDLESAREWTVQLAEPTKGAVHLLVDYVMPTAASQLAALTLPPVVVQDVAFQSSMVAVEGHSELDIKLDTNARAVDVGELSEAVYQPGRRLLGTWSSPDADWQLTAACSRRPIYELPAAIVQRAEMVTSVSTTGKAQTAARFQLVTKDQPFLRIELPAGTTLWAVRLDGQPAKPQLQGEALLVSLVGDKSNQLRDLQLVFESSDDAFRLARTIEAAAPTLWLSDVANEAQTSVPLVDLRWRLILPEGFAVAQGDGAFESTALDGRRSALQQFGRMVSAAGGGLFDSYYRGARRRNQSNNVWQSIKSAKVHKDPAGAFEEREQLSSAMEVDEEATASAELTGMLGFNDDGSRPSQRTIEEQVIEEDPFGDADREESGATKASLWALSGFRSLDIELTQTGNAIDFYNLGEQTTLRASVVNESLVNQLAIVLGLLIAAFGVLLTFHAVKIKTAFLTAVLLVACLLPLAGEAFSPYQTLTDMLLLSVVLVAIYFIVAKLVVLLSRSAASIATAPLWVGLLIALSLGMHSDANAQQVFNDFSDLKRLMTELTTGEKVTLPTDAIIIPFDVDDPRGRERADRLLLPYDHYLRLMQQAEQASPTATPESLVDYVLSSAAYETRLTLDDDVVIRGELTIELLTDDPVAVALPFSGGALADATVDGEPAKLQFQSENHVLNARRKQSAAGSQATPAVRLHLQGRGTKVFAFDMRLKPQRQGGWRLVDAHLPVGLAQKLTVTSLDQATELRFGTAADRRLVDAAANQQIATVLNADGSLDFQWKPKTTKQLANQSLTAQSEAVFDVREDGLRLVWRADLDFRGGKRDEFTLGLPDGFLVEQVEGDNVRAWEVESNDGQRQLRISLLGVARDQESLTIVLSQRDFAIKQQAASFNAPYLTVAGAALHKGTYTIRHAPIVQLKSTDRKSASRIDHDPAKCRLDMQRLDANASPLGITRFQCWQFVTGQFQIGLQASLVPEQLQAQTQSILRLGQSEATVEMKIKVDVGKRPIYKFSFDLPANVDLQQLSAGRGETWTSESNDGGQRVELTFPARVAEDFSIVFDGLITDYSSENDFQIPRVKISGVDQQEGEIAVQVDPAIRVSVGDQTNSETVLLNQVASWLRRDQLANTRLALRTNGSDYDATLRFARIQPRVSVQTITNVRTTRFAIEETLLLDFRIQQAGIRQLKFEVPASLRDARVVAKLVRETIIEDVPDRPEVVQVTLNLQDDVIDLYRVVLEHDRALSDGTQAVPLPRVLTGETEQQYATLQNAGRDEIHVLPSEQFQSLNRRLTQYQQLQRTLSGGELTMAYVTKLGLDQPVLQYETRRRDVFDTVAASIDFSKTTMVVDAGGSYRAVQTFQVNNRSEQYLEIELPAGARLLTVLVEGAPVKPVAWPEANSDRRLRIPLTKTSVGDLDYPVQLKYSGRLGSLNGFAEVNFPVIQTLNINVQLSQLHLRLPESHRWSNFGGTMTQVDSRGELEESFLSYKGRQIQQLAEQIKKTSVLPSSGYARKRAYDNLEQLELEMEEYVVQNEDLAGEQNSQAPQILMFNGQAIDEAKQAYGVKAGEVADQEIDNRENLSKLIARQKTQIARNLVNRAGNNFLSGGEIAGDLSMGRSVDSLPQSRSGKDKESFDGRWLTRNNLQESEEQAWQSKKGIKSQLKSGKQPKRLGRRRNGRGDDIAFSNQASEPTAQLRTRRSLAQDQTTEFGMDMDTDMGMSMGMGGGVGGRGFAAPVVPQLGPPPQVVKKLESLEQAAVNDKIAQPALTSLDVKLPSRGVDYFFKSPRGKVMVTARSMNANWFQRWTSALGAIAVCLSLWALGWLLSRVRQSPALRTGGYWLLPLAGVISLAAGVLPVFGLLAIVVSLALFVRWFATVELTGRAAS